LRCQCSDQTSSSASQESQFSSRQEHIRFLSGSQAHSACYSMGNRAVQWLEREANHTPRPQIVLSLDLLILPLLHMRSCWKRRRLELTGPSIEVLFIQLRTATLRLIVRSGLDVPTVATRHLHACHQARAPSGGRWGEKCPVVLPKCPFPRYI